MYSPPANHNDEQRMRHASARCLRALGGAADGPDAWGWHGRTLSRRVVHPEHGRCWLRVQSAPVGKAFGKLWEGNRAAAALFDGQVHKPVLHGSVEETAGSHTYLAELSQYVDEPVCSATPVLRDRLEPADAWWDSLRGDLERVAKTHTERVAVRQEWVDRCVPQFLNVPAPRIADWETAHGDLHVANLTGGTPYLLDWEGFGRAPVGYDAAMLLAHSILVLAFAQRVRETFPVLHTDAGRVALLVVITELLQAASRGDNTDLVLPLTKLADDVS